MVGRRVKCTATRGIDPARKSAPLENVHGKMQKGGPSAALLHGNNYPDQRTPCISRLISGAISSSKAPEAASSQKPKLKPDSAEAAVMPCSPAM